MAVDMGNQVEDMEAEVLTAAAVRAPHMAAMEAVRALTVATAVEAATAVESLLTERAHPSPLTALSLALVAMPAPEARDQPILVVTATEAMERAPLHSTEAEVRALAMALPEPSHPMVAMEVPLQALATVRLLAMAVPLAMEVPHPVTARALATERA